jgi:5'-deoxynucleotidase
MVTLTNLLTLSHVPRWVIIDTSKSQTVADHSFRVAAICLAFAKELDAIGLKVDIAHVLLKAITHDIGESKSGDIPTPYKKELKSFGFTDSIDDFATIEEYVIKLADLIEAYTFISRYGIKANRVATELLGSLTILRDEAWEVCDFGAVPAQNWWNRIVDKILAIGMGYE